MRERLPCLNDTRENIEAILKICIKAQVRGVICFGMGLTLRDGSREYFYRQLDRYFPGLKDRYIRESGNRYEIPSPRGDELTRLFHHTCEQNGTCTITMRSSHICVVSKKRNRNSACGSFSESTDK